MFVSSLWLCQLVRSRWTAIFGSAVMACSPLLLDLFAVMTEVVFHFFLICALFAAMRMMSSRLEPIRCLILGALVASATLTRHIGVAAIATGLAGLVMSAFTRRARFVDVFKALGIYVAVASLPIAMWAMRSYLKFGEAFHQIGSRPEHITQFPISEFFPATLAVILDWSFPIDSVGPGFVSIPAFGDSSISIAVNLAVASAAAVVLSIAAIGALRSRRAKVCLTEALEWMERNPSVVIVALFIVVYLACLAFALHFGALQPYQRARYLSPLYIPLVLLAIPAFEEAFRHIRKWSGARHRAALVVALVVIGFYFIGVLISSAQSAIGIGRGYDSPAYTESELANQLQRPSIKDGLIFSNNRDIAWWLIDTPDKFVEGVNDCSELFSERWIETKRSTYVVDIAIRRSPGSSCDCDALRSLAGEGLVEPVFEGEIGSIWMVASPTDDCERDVPDASRLP